MGSITLLTPEGADREIVRRTMMTSRLVKRKKNNNKSHQSAVGNRISGLLEFCSLVRSPTLVGIIVGQP